MQADRQAVGQPAGHRDAADIAEVRGDGDDVVQVHGDWILGLRPERERHRRRRRPQQRIDLFEGPLEVVDDQGADLLRLQVIGVVVAGAQRVGPEHDPALDLGAEALLPSHHVFLDEILRAFGLVPVADAVVARQVGAGLGGRDDVVGGQGDVAVRQAHFLD